MKRHAHSFVAVVVVALIAAAGLAVPAHAGAGLDRTERELVWRVNEIRAQHGLGRLRSHRPLCRAADEHSRDMLAWDFLDHTSSDGTPFDRRVRRFADFGTVGEALAAVPRREGGADEVVQMWMDSPDHRAILLVAEFRRIGVARRWGTLGGAGQAVVTADFGS
jgi:uncharacterized protein YkwD